MGFVLGPLSPEGPHETAININRRLQQILKLGVRIIKIFMKITFAGAK